MSSLLSRKQFLPIQPKITHKQIPKFSDIAQFCLIFFLFAKHFVTDCGITGLVTTVIFSTKAKDIENKVLDIADLGIKAALNTKAAEIENVKS